MTFNKKIIRITLFILGILCLAVALFLGYIYYSVQEEGHTDATCEQLSFAQSNDQKWVIHPFLTDSGYVLVMPAHWKIENLQVKYNLEGEKSAPAWLPYNGPIGIFHNAKIKSGDEEYDFGRLAIYQSSITSFFIRTESRSMEAINESEDKSHHETGMARIISTDGNSIYDGKLTKIKGHGNATWSNEPKKSYNIELKRKCDIFGDVKETRFSLISNAVDTTNIKNWLSYYTAEKMQMPHSFRYEYVSLFCNGYYQGLYLLCSKIIVGKKHIDLKDLEADNELVNSKKLKHYPRARYDAQGREIADEDHETKVAKSGIKGAINPEDITGGYIVESPPTGSRPVGSFTTSRGTRMVLRFPKFPTIEEVNYIQQAYDAMECAIMSPEGVNTQTGKRYTDYIDTLSFAKYYLINEFFMNRDCEKGSFFTLKDTDSRDSLFYAAPIWDMDNISSGVHYNFYNAYVAKNGMAILNKEPGMSREYHPKMQSSLFEGLCNHPDFWQKVREVYINNMDSVLTQLFTCQFDSICEVLRNDARIDAALWYAFASNEDEIADLKNLYTERLKFFSHDMRLSEQEYHKVILNLGDNRIRKYHLLEFHVPHGETFHCPELHFSRYNDPQIICNGQEIGNDIVVTEDMEIEYVWEKKLIDIPLLIDRIEEKMEQL